MEEGQENNQWWLFEKGSFKSITHFNYDLTDLKKKEDIHLFSIKAVPHLLSQKKHKEIECVFPQTFQF